MRINKPKFIRFLVVLISIILLIAILVTQFSKTNEIDHTEEHIVTSGETLWQLCTEYKPKNMSIQEYIFNVQEYNNIGSIIFPEQRIQFLVYKEA